MISYHGTDPSTAHILFQGHINVAIGGGELGQGFYTGEYLHEAKTWALHRFKATKRNVLSVELDESIFFNLNLLPLDHRQATWYRTLIRNIYQTRSYIFGHDLIWSEIIGSAKATGDQYKWESSFSQTLLNSIQVVRNII